MSSKGLPRLHVRFIENHTWRGNHEGAEVSAEGACNKQESWPPFSARHIQIRSLQTV